MINTLYLPEIREMLAEQNTRELREFCTALHPARTAEFMGGLNATEAWEVLKNAEPLTRVEIFGYFDEAMQVEILGGGPRDEVSLLVADLPADDRVDLLNKVDPQVVSEMLPLIPTEERRDILRLGAYPEGTAGSVMTSETAQLDESLSVGEAFEVIKQKAAQWETIHYLYVTDQHEHLRGVVTARQLLAHVGRPDTPLTELMERDVFCVHVDDDQEKVATQVAQYNLHAIPVVDREHRLLGIITHDDIIDVVLEEAAEDAQLISAVDPLDESYLGTSVWILFRKRVLWLTILMLAALLTVIPLTRFKDRLDRIEWLVLFIPLIISSGGNSGGQSATLIITAMKVGEVQLQDWWRVFRRELSSGLMLGGFLAVIGYGVAVWFAPGALDALVVPVTVLLVVLTGTMCGALLPLLFRRLGWDPAMMSHPFVAGIVDIAGICIYLLVAYAIIRM